MEKSVLRKKLILYEGYLKKVRQLLNITNIKSAEYLEIHKDYYTLYGKILVMKEILGGKYDKWSN